MRRLSPLLSPIKIYGGRDNVDVVHVSVDRVAQHCRRGSTKKRFRKTLVQMM
jgi:hypothetical protein